MFWEYQLYGELVSGATPRLSEHPVPDVSAATATTVRVVMGLLSTLVVELGPTNVTVSEPCITNPVSVHSEAGKKVEANHATMPDRSLQFSSPLVSTSSSALGLRDPSLGAQSSR
jgi:hypothetical protein